MGISTIKFKQNIPTTINKAWSFFSSPRNLTKICPPELKFKIVNISDDKAAYSGQMIEYRVNPLPFMRLTWLTEITHVEEEKFFVDEQRVGPYKIWHHEHHFEELEDGILMTDIITYKIPMGFLGDLMKGDVRRRLNRIFDYREEQIKKIFG